MPTRILEVKAFDLEVPQRAKADLRKACLAAHEAAKVRATATELVLGAGGEQVTLTGDGTKWGKPSWIPTANDAEPLLAVVGAAVRAFGGTLVARVERDGEAQEVRIEAPKGGGEAPAVWAAKRVLAEVVKIATTDASAALAAVSERPAVTREDVDQALGAEAERVWKALDGEGLVRNGKIPTRSLYIWTMKKP